MRVSVIGGGTVTDEEYATAETLGRELGERGHDVVCGGLGGVMAAVCEGATAAGGHTLGILPGEDPAAANDHVETAVATGLGHTRNALVVLNGDAVIAVDGGPGTLSEIGYALVYDRPVAGIGTHDVPGVAAVDGPAAAVDHVEAVVEDETADDDEAATNDETADDDEAAVDDETADDDVEGAVNDIEGAAADVEATADDEDAVDDG